MKKILPILLLIALTVCALVSCEFPPLVPSGPGGEDEQKYDGTIYSPESGATLVKSADAPAYVNVAYMAMQGELSSMGISAAMRDDSVAQSGSEIALGHTTRAASVAAEELVDVKHSNGDITFAIVYKKGVLAFYAADDESFEAGLDYLYENYINSNTLKVDTSLSYVFDMTADEYEIYISDKATEELLANWDNRFDYLKDYISEGAVNSLKYMYNLYDEKLYLWVANLWDDEIGAFYYACSSRDYMGFAPDVESTCQAIKIVCGSGMTDKWGGGLESIDAAFPQQMQDKIIDFVFSLYCDDDGYFYHDQWGKEINDDRKGRDLTWSMQLVNYFGETLPEGWVDAVTRLKNQNSAVSSLSGRSTVSAVSSVMSESSVSAVASDNRFSSRENFIAYLDSLDILSNSYGKGHQLASQADQIKAAGLIDLCCDYLNNLQTQIYEEQQSMGMDPNGLWEHETNYHSISGFFKLAVVYSSAKRSQQYLDRVLDSCIKCLLSDEEAGQVVYVYNPWAAIGECFGGMQRANEAAVKANQAKPYDIEKCRKELLYPNVEEMFDKTYEKAILFRKNDGGYSYNLNNSAPTIQGAFASMGFAEGDMNATALLAYHMIGYMEGALGFSLPPIWNIKDYERFMYEIDNLEYAPKKPSKTEVNADFDSYTKGDTVNDGTVSADNQSSVLFVDEDPQDYTNMALKLESVSGSAAGFKAFTNMTAKKNCFVFSADFNITKKTSGTSHQISFYAGNDRNYMLTFSGGTSSVALGDASNVKGVGIKNTSFGVAIPTGEWFNLKVELYIESVTELKAKIYVNDQYIMTSTNYFGSEVEGTPMSEGVVNYVWFYGLISSESDLYVDNLFMRYEDKEYSENDNVLTREESYDFESTNLKYGANLRAENSYAKIEQLDEDASGESGNVYHVSKTGTNSWDQLSFKLPTDKDTDVYLTYSMDFKFNQFNGTAQLSIGSLDPNAYYLMLIKSAGASFNLSDSSTMQSGYKATTTNFDGSFSCDEWHNLTIELYVSESSSDFEANIYIDETLVGKSKNFYNYSSETNAAPNLTLDFVNIRFTSGTTVDMYMDNVSISYE